MNAKMLGKTANGGVVCECCIAPSWRKTMKRGTKRRERQAWKKDVRLS